MSLTGVEHGGYQRRFTITFWGIDDLQTMKDMGYRVSEEQSGITRLMLGGIGDAPTQEVLAGVAAYLSREALVATKGSHCSEQGLACKVKFTGACTQVFCCCKVIADALVSIQKKLFYNTCRLTLNPQRDSTKQGTDELSLVALHGSKPLSLTTIGGERLFPSIQQLQCVVNNLQFTLDSLRLFILSAENSLNDQELSVYGISRVDTLINIDIQALAFDLYHNTTDNAINAYKNALIDAAKLIETIFEYGKLVISPYKFIWNGVAIVVTHDPWNETRKKLIELRNCTSHRIFSGDVIKYDIESIINAHGSLNCVLQNIYNTRILSLHDAEISLLDGDEDGDEHQINTSHTCTECLAILNAVTDQDQRSVENMEQIVADIWEHCESITEKGSIISISFSGDQIPYSGFLNNESKAWVSFSGLEFEVDSCPWKGVLIIQPQINHIQTLQEALNRASYKSRTLYAVKIICPPELIDCSQAQHEDMDGDGDESTI